VARVSVVVPIYNVEPFLDECLRSIAGQTFADLEVVMVDDGSTDTSAAIAERFAQRDARFRLISQPNAGLGAARNAGLDAASGEHLAFVDSDDVLPRDAYERLIGSLERTGSDFATGNVLRLSSRGCTQASFLAHVFSRSRPRAHVRGFAPLISDRTACNKLFRRDFWDGLGLRFPEGRLHEDIALMLRAHYAARAVDVVAAPVYHYRRRETGELSITQRRHELRALRDRVTAVEEVHALLRETERARQLRRYERSVVSADLRYHLNLLDRAGDDYRAHFLVAANAFLDRAHGRVLHGQPALERLKWELVRRRALPELLETLRFQREETLRTPPLRSLGGGYRGDFPHRDDRSLRLPRAAFRLGRRDPELSLTARLEDVRFEDGAVRLFGHAYVTAVGAIGPEVQRVSIAAVRPGRFRALRMRVASRRFPTGPERRNDLGDALRWSGFRTMIRPAELAAEGEARWDAFAFVQSGRLRRRRARFDVDRPVAVDAPPEGDALVRAVVASSGALSVTVHHRWLRIEARRMAEGQAVELSGRAAGAVDELEIACEGRLLRRPLALDNGGTFRVRVPLHELRGGGDELQWTLTCGRAPVVLDAGMNGARWLAAGSELALARDASGAVLLSERALRPMPVAPSAPRALLEGDALEHVGDPLAGVD
jgi:CDP-glycerol glycerophosphotransferase